VAAVSELWLLAMKGPPGSGKSTLARALGRRLGWPLIDKDDIRDLEATPQPGLSYNAMLNIGRRQLLQGLSVICDSPLGYRRTYETAARIAGELSARLVVVECHCPDEVTWQRRIEERQALNLPSHHTIDWAAVEAFRRRTAADGAFAITHPHLVVDTTAPLDEVCERVVLWISEQQGTDPALRSG
jgi:predicted kinase